MTGGTYQHPVTWGDGELPYACDDCQAPAFAVRAGGFTADNDDCAPDHAWCMACWSQRWGAKAA